MIKFESFRGVAPKRFRYLFKKYKSDRKNENKVKQWDIANSNSIHVSHSTVISYFWIEDQYSKVLIRESKEHLKDEFVNNLLSIETKKEQLFKTLLDDYSQDEII